jgi:hypothetical protein
MLSVIEGPFVLPGCGSVLQGSAVLRRDAISTADAVPEDSGFALRPARRQRMVDGPRRADPADQLSRPVDDCGRGHGDTPPRGELDRLVPTPPAALGGNTVCPGRTSVACMAAMAAVPASPGVALGLRR